jgi:hypothetical protein
MTLRELITKLQKTIKDNPDYEDMEIRDMNLDIAGTTKNLKLSVQNGMLSISNGLFNE